MAAPEFGLAQSRARLDPAEDLLDALAAPLADAVTGMARRAPVYLGLAPLAGLGDVVLDGDMGGHLAVPQFLDKIRDVKTLVPAHRDPTPAASTLHRAMPVGPIQEKWGRPTPFALLLPRI